jgi:hypothetical protein
MLEQRDILSFSLASEENHENSSQHKYPILNENA